MSKAANMQFKKNKQKNTKQKKSVSSLTTAFLWIILFIIYPTLMINIPWHVPRQNLGVKGKAISVQDGKNKHY